MVSEFCQIMSHPHDAPLPPNSRRLSTLSRGTVASEKPEETSSRSVGSPKDQHQTVTIGIHHSPEEFVQKALEIGHPTRMHSFFPDEMEEVVSHYMNNSVAAIAQARAEEIRRWLQLKLSLSNEEISLKGERKS